MKIEGRSVVLTGATGGLGQAIARALARRGARLTLTGRRVEVLEPLAAELGAGVLAVDLTDREAVTGLAKRVGGCDILVANAGLPGTGRLDELGVDAIDRVLDVNLRAPMLLARSASTGMRERSGGHIVLVSSLSGLAPSPFASVYGATKAGLRGFGLALREELRGTGIGVSIVYPGPISNAGMFAETGVTLPARVGMSTPEDVARAVVRSIESNRAEVMVAPLPMKAAIPLALVAPGVNAAVQRHFGGNRVAAELAVKQSHKR
jgi:short-subunit dehydrogenase